MKTLDHLLFTAALLLLAFSTTATTFYVNVSNTVPAVPYDTWAHAATNIQRAVDYANFQNTFQPNAGSIFWVSNGIYKIGSGSLNGLSRVEVTNSYIVKSVNGPAVTIIQGHQATNINDTPVRCVYLGGGATLSGFTLTNGGDGSQMAGGVGCLDTNEIVTNCVIIGNQGFYGGGVYQGFVKNCVIANNFSGNYAGGAYQSILDHGLITNNSAGYWTGGVMWSTLNNCLLIGNYPNPYSYGDTAVYSQMVNCTLIGYGLGYDPVYSCHLTNCILFPSVSSPLWLGSSSFANCCVMPLPAGQNNFTNSPLFVNIAAGDYHLQSNSPCINAGKNSFVATTNDLDGNPRIAGGTVDIGCYEYQSPSSVLSYAWAQQFNLPTDGSADFTDADGDGLNNWQEWIAGTIPTNPASLLLLNAPTNAATGLSVGWQSVATRTYFLQRSTNLPVFTTIQSNLVGQATTTTFNDTSATNGGPYFYRVGVQSF